MHKNLKRYESSPLSLNEFKKCHIGKKKYANIYCNLKFRSRTCKHPALKLTGIFSGDLNVYYSGYENPAYLEG
jgi:hypothetical protein